MMPYRGGKIVTIDELIATTWDYSFMKILGFFNNEEVTICNFIALDADVFYQKYLKIKHPMSLEESLKIPRSKMIKRCNVYEEWVEFLDGHKEPYGGRVLLITKTGEDIITFNKKGLVIKLKGFNI